MQRAPKPEKLPAKAPTERVRPARTTVADRQGRPRGGERPANPGVVNAGNAAKRPEKSREGDRFEGHRPDDRQDEPKVGDRLAKRVAEQAKCSRSQAEQYIEGGWVRVDGQVVEAAGARVLPAQVIELDKNASLLGLQSVTILMHKPVGYDSGEGRNPALLLLSPEKMAKDVNVADSGIRFLQRHFANLTPTTPLPVEASGLIVFTQDFRIARKLNDDADRVEQECLVQVEGELTDQAIDRLCHGLHFNGVPLPPIKVSLAQQTESETWLRFAFKGIRPGQIPQMCERVGLRVLAIKRIRIGRMPMSDLAVGEWRYLPSYKRF